MKELRKIMLVEDDDNIRAIATRTLEKLGGFKVTACPSGIDALNQISTDTPQLIIMDVMMPELSGIETLQKLKLREDTKDIPVIFSTARVQPSQVEEYKKMDVIGVISKPFDPMALGDLVKNIWLDYTQTQSTSPSPKEQTKKNSEAIASLFQAYANSFPEKLTNILDDWDKLHDKEITPQDWHRLHFNVHQLGGSSGSFGFSEESILLRKLENIIEPFRKSPAPPSAFKTIDEITTELKVKLDKHIAKKNAFL